MTTAAAADPFVHRVHRILLAAGAVGILAFAAVLYVFPDGHVFFDRGVKFYDVSDLVVSSPERPAPFASAEALVAELHRRVPSCDPLLAHQNQHQVIARGSGLDHLHIRQALSSLREAHASQP